MITYSRLPEPEYFDKNIRQPGLAFLRGLGRKPTQKEWSNNALWGLCRNDLLRMCKGICGYTGMRMNGGQFVPNIDHFIPKSRNMWLAYEWDNLRLVSPLINTKKGTKQVVDFFDISNGDVIIDIPSLKLKMREGLDPNLAKKVKDTIKILDLDSQPIIEQRYLYFCMVAFNCPIDAIEVAAPIIAYTRQDDPELFDRFLESLRELYSDCPECSMGLAFIV